MTNTVVCGTNCTKSCVMFIFHLLATRIEHAGLALLEVMTLDENAGMYETYASREVSLKFN